MACPWVFPAFDIPTNLPERSAIQHADAQKPRQAEDTREDWLGAANREEASRPRVRSLRFTANAQRRRETSSWPRGGSTKLRLDEDSGDEAEVDHVGRSRLNRFAMQQQAGVEAREDRSVTTNSQRLAVREEIKPITYRRGNLTTEQAAETMRIRRSACAQSLLLGKGRPGRSQLGGSAASVLETRRCYWRRLSRRAVRASWVVLAEPASQGSGVSPACGWIEHASCGTRARRSNATSRASGAVRAPGRGTAASQPVRHRLGRTSGGMLLARRAQETHFEACALEWRESTLNAPRAP